jgi:YegS/Rv2252/BmrU family lipid kinase
LKNATLIYNPIAGRKPQRREREIRKAAAALEDAGIAVQLAPTTGPGAAEELARAAASRGGELILVCGGDGTINEVINGMTPSPATLGILPGGTANIIARELGIPKSPVQAARCLPFWSPRRIALGQVSWFAAAAGKAPQPRQRYFLSVAGAGFDAHVVYKLATTFKLAWGVPAYAWEAVRQTLRYSFPPFVCRVDDQPHQATFAVIQRTKRYGGPLRLTPNAEFFEPRFGLCLFSSRRITRWVAFVLAALARQHHRLRGVQMIQGRKVVCEAVEPGTHIHFELDGELVGTLPATFEVVPEALNLLVP